MTKLASFISFSGRVKRAKFLQMILWTLLAWLAAAFIDETLIAPNLCLINEQWICYLPGEVREGITLDKIVSVLLLLPFFAVVVRRLHDHGMSGWWSLLSLPLLYLLAVFLYSPEAEIPNWQLAVGTASFLPLLFWVVKKGMCGQNRFG